MVLPIYIYGQPVLRKVSQDIAQDYPNLKELIANMFETLTASDGVGLAAPQIGLDIVLPRRDACRCREYMKVLSVPHVYTLSIWTRILRSTTSGWTVIWHV